MVGHQPAKFGGHRQYGCRGITFLIVEEQDSTCSIKSAITVYLNSTWHVMLSHKISECRHSYLPYHVNKSDTGHKRLEQRWKKEYRNNFCQGFAVEKKKK